MALTKTVMGCLITTRTAMVKTRSVLVEQIAMMPMPVLVSQQLKYPRMESTRIVRVLMRFLVLPMRMEMALRRQRLSHQTMRIALMRVSLKPVVPIVMTPMHLLIQGVRKHGRWNRSRLFGVGYDHVFVDSDGDGFGTSAYTILATDGDCTDAGESTLDTDCDDTNASVNPSASEVPGDGVDNNCDGAESAICYTDSDGDGFGSLIPVIPWMLTALIRENQATVPTATMPIAQSFQAELRLRMMESIKIVVDAISCFVDADGDGYGGTTVSVSENCSRRWTCQ